VKLSGWQQQSPLHQQDESSENNGNQDSQSDQKSPDSQKKQDQQNGQQSMQQLAKQQEMAQQQLEELKRMLRELQKLNQGEDMEKQMSQLEKHQNTQELSKNMQKSQQSMQGGKPKEASPYAFKANQEAKQLADMARSMQQNMQSDKEDQSAKALQRVIEGLIDVSGAQEDVAQSQEEPRALAERQLGLTDAAGSLADSLEAVMKQSFTIETPQLKNLHSAINRMADRGNRCGIVLPSPACNPVGTADGPCAEADAGDVHVGATETLQRNCRAGFWYRRAPGHADSPSSFRGRSRQPSCLRFAELRGDSL